MMFLVQVVVVIFLMATLPMANGWGCLHKTTFSATTTRLPISLLPSSSSSLSSSPSLSPSLLFHSKNNNQNVVQDKKNENSNSNDNDNDNNDDDENTTNDKTAEIIVEVEEAEVEWGVSYIGGDPCGSKYNNDPFDASNKSSSTGTGDNNTSSKPGMPDDMKARIQALAEKKLREQ
mmetsp:Transcript_12532/g.13745  ORF Transcript_12532/g.13745 Transcript_12532/m.13745 type:complete len:176 (-) Transcript_12532:294-821(-)